MGEFQGIMNFECVYGMLTSNPLSDKNATASRWLWIHSADYSIYQLGSPVTLRLSLMPLQLHIQKIMGAGGNFLWCQYSLLSCVLHGLQEYKHVQNLCLSWTSLVPRPYVGIYDLPVGTIMTRCFNKCDWEALQEDMMAAPWQKVEKCYNIDRKTILLEPLDNCLEANCYLLFHFICSFQW